MKNGMTQWLWIGKKKAWFQLSAQSLIIHFWIVAFPKEELKKQRNTYILDYYHDFSSRWMIKISHWQDKSWRKRLDKCSWHSDDPVMPIILVVKVCWMMRSTWSSFSHRSQKGDAAECEWVWKGLMEMKSLYTAFENGIICHRFGNYSESLFLFQGEAFSQDPLNAYQSKRERGAKRAPKMMETLRRRPKGYYGDDSIRHLQHVVPLSMYGKSKWVHFIFMFLLMPTCGLLTVDSKVACGGLVFVN